MYPHISTTPNNRIQIRQDPMKNINNYKITDDQEDIGGPENDNEDSRKKKKHRETEKQRRMEMASLFGDLRSLLPLDFIRGKRSMPDQMNEAVNYIRHLEAEIKELQVKRDKMKNIINSGSSSSEASSKNVVMIQPSWGDGDGAVQILINTSSSVCSLSVVMKLLAQEGVNVSNYFTSQVEDRTIYKIQCQVNIDAESPDLIYSKLQEKLESLLYY